MLDMNDTPSLERSLSDGDTEELQNALKMMSPFEIADIMTHKSREDQQAIFKALSIDHATETFEFLSIKVQREILQNLPAGQAAAILQMLPPDDRTALLEELPRNVIDAYIKFLPNNERYLILTLLGYPEGSIGRLMTTDYIAVKSDWSIEEVFEHIRDYGHDSETIDVIYVIDDDDKLIDDIKLKDFLFVPRTHKVSNLLDFQYIALSVMDNDEKAINIFRKNDRVALPVIDEDCHMLGIVTIDDVLRLAEKESTADFQKMGGMEALDAPYLQTPIQDLVKKRGGWLTVLFLGEMLTATAMSYFEDEISKAVVLALFLPLILSSGGNAGSQAASLIIRAMTLGEVTLKDWWKILKRELTSGIILGGLLGTIGAIRVIMWGSIFKTYGEHWLIISFAIFLSLIGVVLWSTLTGALLPLLLKWFKFDPATSSTPCIATLVDVTGIVIYFLICMVVLKGTLL